MVGHFVDATGKTEIVETVWDVVVIKDILCLGLFRVRQFASSS